ncbi:hypothetical protein HCJ58_15330, partial [Listeria sp. FSL L7-1509]|nr:hypothetical protein [Listeria immobilis]
QQVGNDFKVPWELLASWHKAESNFDTDKRVANNMNVIKYFSEKINKNKDKQPLELEVAVQQLAQDLVTVKEDGKFLLEKLIPVEKNTDVEGFINKVRIIYKTYKNEEYVVKETVLKDWNDVQKQRHQPKLASRNTRASELYKNDIKQVLEVTRIERKEDSSQKEYQA